MGTMRRLELLASVGTCIAALGAILATIVLPVGTERLAVDGRTVSVVQIFARDRGVAPLVGTCMVIALLAALVLWGAYLHARRGDLSGRSIIWVSALIYLLFGAWSLPQGGFAQYPAFLAILCGLCALLPVHQQPPTEAHGNNA